MFAAIRRLTGFRLVIYRRRMKRPNPPSSPALAGAKQRFAIISPRVLGAFGLSLMLGFIASCAAAEGTGAGEDRFQHETGTRGDEHGDAHAHAAGQTGDARHAEGNFCDGG